MARPASESNAGRPGRKKTCLRARTGRAQLGQGLFVVNRRRGAAATRGMKKTQLDQGLQRLVLEAAETWKRPASLQWQTGA